MANGLSVRQELNRKGIDNTRIGFNPSTGAVYVDNKEFMRPPKIINGTAFTDQNTFNDAYTRFTQSQQPTAQPTTTMQAQQTGMSSMSTTQPRQTSTYQPSTDYNSILRNLVEQASTQRDFDPYKTDAYRAAEEQSRRAQREQTRAAQEAYGSAGFGRSSALGERVAGIAGDQREYLMTQVIPQIVAQEEARRQQQLQNQFGILGALMDRDRLAMQEAGLTGTYLPPEMRNLYNQVIDLKQQWDTASPEQRPEIEAQANAIRSLIAGMGGDPNLVGRDVTLQQAQSNIPRFGIPTLAAQQQQFTQGLQTRQQDLSELQVMAALTGLLPDGTPTTAEQQRQLENLWMVADQTGIIPNELADLYNIPRGTQTQAAKQMAFQNMIARGQLGVSQMNAQTSRMNAEQNRLMDIWKATGVAPEGITGVAPGTPWAESSAPQSGSLTANQFLNSIQSQYMEPIIDEQGVSTGQTRITTNPQLREQMFWQVVDAGYDNTTTDQILRALGFTADEINKYAGQ